jgi:predicted homoserine dehydrogenase-like protein
VFVVVRCHDRKSWEVLRAKGHVVSRSGDAAMIYRPSHLLGLESATTVLSAVLEGRSSGPEDVRPRFDVVGRTTKLLAKGTVLSAVGHHHQIQGVEGLMVQARRAQGGNPMPFYLMADHPLAQDVPAGTVITADMVEPPADSLLWRLRREMEEAFNLP